MKKLCITLLMVGAWLATSAQQPAFLTAIAQHLQSPAGRAHYDSLLHCYLAGEVLDDSGYYWLYYGQHLQSFYRPYGQAAGEAAFTAAYNQGNFGAAAELGEALLKESPLQLRLLYRLLVCYHVLEELQAADRHAERYFGLLRTIYQSGDGKSMPTAWVVMQVADEYVVLQDLELRVASQSLRGTTDVLEVSRLARPELPNYQLYFNVSVPLGHLSALLQE